MAVDVIMWLTCENVMSVDGRLWPEVTLDRTGAGEILCGVGAAVDELDLLAALQLRWHTRLSGRIETELSSQPMDLEDVVARAWHGTADDLPGIRTVLDRYHALPVDEAMAVAMAKLQAKEHLTLAVMAVRGAFADAECVRLGSMIEARARVEYESAVEVVERGPFAGSPVRSYQARRGPGATERQTGQAFLSVGDGFIDQNEIHVIVISPHAVSVSPSRRRW